VNTAKLATLGNLIRGVAHEINTPLGALSSNYDVTRRALGRLQVILEDEVVDESELGEVRRIVKAVDGVQETNAMAVERMVKLVQTLRTFGRPDRSDLDHIDLHEALESTLRLVSHELGTRVRIAKEFGEIPLVECYGHQVNQVFMNLLVNAAHAIPEQGTITIRTRSDGNGVVVEVEDTGVGIPPENLERVFEPGFTTKGKRVGMGLGLLISRQIVERHHGRISVRSAVGQGTSFTVELPLRHVRDKEEESKP
jgi:two-component system, NtrC family, sensor kinase